MANVFENFVDWVGKQWNENSEKFLYKDECSSEIKFEKTYDKFDWLIKGGLGIGGAYLGSKLGENFGTGGKVVLGLIGAFAAPKISNYIEEIGTDIASAKDYAKQNNGVDSKISRFDATIANLGNFGGQTYDGRTTSAPDVMD